MKNALHNYRRGFTVVELMIVVAIISLLASIAVPSYMRARKRSQAVRVLEDLRALDFSLNRWAIEKNKSPGDLAELSDLRPYIKSGSRLNEGLDILGNSFGTQFSVDSIPRVPTLTYNLLSDIAPASFWSPYN